MSRLVSSNVGPIVTRTLSELKRAGTPERARGAAAYFKAYEKLEFFGVDSATVRKMAARMLAEDGRAWTVAEAIAFADAMLRQPQLEAKGLGACVLGRFHRQFVPSMLPRTRGWLANCCADWASTDTLCGEVIGPLLVMYPALVSRTRAWRASRFLYVRRASAVALIPSVRRRQALDDAYEAALVLGGEDHHLLQKAAGWLLREAGKADMPRLARFLVENGARLSRTSVNYAIERFPTDERRRLLSETRPHVSAIGPAKQGSIRR